jgi:D-ribulokinase
MADAALPASAVKGIGFDATCSLVVLDAGGNPLRSARRATHAAT